jgi:agmatine deiminase
LTFLRFDYIPYPLWRRQMPGLLRAAAAPLFRRYLAADVDLNPPMTPAALARYLARWGLLNGTSEADAARALTEPPAQFERSREGIQPQPAAIQPLRLPAQWEPMETVILTWPILYPPLWAQHAQMVEAITPVASVTVLVPSALWASAAHCFLAKRGQAVLDKVRFLELPTDDMWVRDYGPIVGLDESGGQVCVKTTFDPLPRYPQTRDNAMPLRWAAHEEIPVQSLDLHLEGGNLWSDGAGTLIMSEQTLIANPGLTHQALADQLRRVFNIQKLILTPRLKREETGHVDLLVKLANPTTLLVSAPTVWYNGDTLRRAADLFRRETNAAGQPYRVLELPTPPLYLNWGVYPIWRSYTNSLTVNGRVLVPVFGLDLDEHALAVYRAALPNHAIIPIDCRAGVNGGGAVHCLTKEVPRRRG